jgi:hypothetical protein
MTREILISPMGPAEGAQKSKRILAAFPGTGNRVGLRVSQPIDASPSESRQIVIP